MAKFLTNGALAERVATQVSSATTVTLISTSATVQEFTGTIAQTVQLPDANTLTAGMRYDLLNRTTATMQILLGDGFTVLGTITAGGQATCRVMTAGSLDGSWDFGASNPGGGPSFSLVAGGLETLTDLQYTVTVPVGTAHFQPFLDVPVGMQLTVDGGLVTVDGTIDGTVTIAPGGIWRVL